MSADNINELCQLWAASSNNNQPFVSRDHLHETIDATVAGNIPQWQCFYVSRKSKGDNDIPAPWKVAEYPVYFRDPRAILHMQLGNPDFKSEMAAQDKIAKDENIHGATFCPIILGSDKTTVSVATGQNDYYSLYLSNGLVHNNVRRAHCNAVSLIGFLSVPKSEFFFNMYLLCIRF